MCKEFSVRPDWRVQQFEKAFYTVPHRLIGKRVLAMGNSHTVRIFLDHEEITAHQRATRPWGIKRKSEHAPPELEQYLNLTSEGLVQWAQRLGNAMSCQLQAATERVRDLPKSGDLDVLGMVLKPGDCGLSCADHVCQLLLCEPGLLTGVLEQNTYLEVAITCFKSF